jgi:hypothetical protein
MSKAVSVQRVLLYLLPIVIQAEFECWQLGTATQ